MRQPQLRHGSPQKVPLSMETGILLLISGLHFWTEIISNNETITKEICTSPIIAVIPKGFPLFLFLVIAFLFSFLTLFILLPDGWTLINLKVRLDNWVNSLSNHGQNKIFAAIRLLYGKCYGGDKSFFGSNNGFLFVCKQAAGMNRILITRVKQSWDWTRYDKKDI